MRHKIFSILVLLPITGFPQIEIGQTPEGATTITGTAQFEGNIDLTLSEPTVPTSPNPWETSFTLGLGISEVTDREYTLKNDLVLRDHEAEDAREFPTLFFVHITRNLTGPNAGESNGQPQTWRHRYGVGLSLGVSEQEGRDANHFVGLSVHFGHQAYLTFGRHWRSVRIPGPGGASTLDDLQFRRRGGTFVSLSYPFAGSRDGFIRLTNPTAND